ncbi:hypothetical protein [Adlercreutzia aquisgranensis]|uniref:hypothetical protein n=1 Tax=Adlercreutzia aquisgranensis TaxID=2941323 RepID=UPI00203B07E5|nr:hypothetical protein [Adlercreutzia aquisgranensis]
MGVLMGMCGGVRGRWEPIASEKLDVTDDGYGRNLCNERRLCTVSCNGRRLWQVSIAINVVGYIGRRRLAINVVGYIGRRRLAINVIGYMGLERFVTTGASYMGRAARLPQSPSTSIGLERLAINVVGYIGRRWIAINGASCMGCTARLPQSLSTNMGRRRLAKLPLAALVLAICHNRRRLHGVAPPDDEDAVAERGVRCGDLMAAAVLDARLVNVR